MQIQSQYNGNSVTNDFKSAFNSSDKLADEVCTMSSEVTAVDVLKTDSHTCKVRSRRCGVTTECKVSDQSKSVYLLPCWT